jgi:hypothetical protein
MNPSDELETENSQAMGISAIRRRPSIPPNPVTVAINRHGDASTPHSELNTYRLGMHRRRLPTMISGALREVTRI